MSAAMAEWCLFLCLKFSTCLDKDILIEMIIRKENLEKISRSLHHKYLLRLLFRPFIGTSNTKTIITMKINALPT